MKATIEKYEKQHIQVQDEDGKPALQEVAMITLMSEVPEVLPVGQVVELSVPKTKAKK